MAVIRAVLPCDDSEGPDGVAAAALAHLGTMSAILWLDLLLAATLMVGVAVVCVAGVRAVPVRGGTGSVLAALGFGAMVPAVVPEDVVIVPSPPLTAVAWVLTAVGFAGAAGSFATGRQ